MTHTQFSGLIRVDHAFQNPQNSYLIEAFAGVLVPVLFIRQQDTYLDTFEVTVLHAGLEVKLERDALDIVLAVDQQTYDQHMAS